MGDAVTMAAAGHGALETIVLVAGPILGSIMMIGIAVSILQAATQINEATLSFVPKFLGAVVVVALGGPWLLRQLETFFVTVLGGPLGPGS
ncbi:MAG TPA: flagellar biosynthetic protein FliQ [Stellaceae bacterium]|nr:flagellar biosynthetic protein FliQ [Stellaceae bacterium]